MCLLPKIWISLIVLLALQTTLGLYSLTEQDSKDEVGLVNYALKAQVSGIRVVNIPNQDGFIAYTEAGVSVIYPNKKVRIVIFGMYLDRIGIVSFTTDNCHNSVLNVTQSEFLLRTDKRLDFYATFAESDTPFRICYREQINHVNSDEEEEDMVMIDEMRAWITTEIPARIYYLPIYLQAIIIFVLFCLSALFSGLNLGLMALSPQELMLIQKSGSEKEKQNAETILKVRQYSNYLLCTILITNVVVNAAISILLEDVTSGALAFLISSAGIVIIGEIIPQSVCIKNGLAVGAHTIWLTRFFMIITFPLSYPISKILDIFLGEDAPVYDRKK